MEDDGATKKARTTEAGDAVGTKDALSGALEAAVEAARAAGRLLMERWGSDDFRVEYKGTVDIVTEVDKAAEKAIIGILKSATPTWNILAEESGHETVDEESAYRWIIDPLDGTTSFAHGHPFFSVSIGLHHRSNGLLLGVIYHPPMDELFVAQKGKGATRNGKPIQVSKTSELVKALVASGFPYDRATCPEAEKNVNYITSMALRARAFRRNGSAALDMCYVACGRQDVYWEWKLCPWDVAAGYLMVQEAGGKVTDLWGKPVDINQGRIHSVVSNGALHTATLEVFRGADAALGVSPDAVAAAAPTGDAV